MSFEDWVELAGKVLAATGVLVITFGIFVVTAVPMTGGARSQASSTDRTLTPFQKAT